MPHDKKDDIEASRDHWAREEQKRLNATGRSLQSHIKPSLSEEVRQAEKGIDLQRFAPPQESFMDYWQRHNEVVKAMQSLERKELTVQDITIGKDAETIEFGDFPKVTLKLTPEQVKRAEDEIKRQQVISDFLERRPNPVHSIAWDPQVYELVDHDLQIGIIKLRRKAGKP